MPILWPIPPITLTDVHFLVSKLTNSTQHTHTHTLPPSLAHTHTHSAFFSIAFDSIVVIVDEVFHHHHQHFIIDFIWFFLFLFDFFFHIYNFFSYYKDPSLYSHLKIFFFLFFVFAQWNKKRTNIILVSVFRCLCVCVFVNAWAASMFCSIIIQWKRCMKKSDDDDDIIFFLVFFTINTKYFWFRFWWNRLFLSCCTNVCEKHSTFPFGRSIIIRIKGLSFFLVFKILWI